MAAGGARGAASVAAMRAMIDAACAIRPGSAAEQSGATAAAAAAAAEADDDQVEPVDTKSYRRLVEDMKRRGWLVIPVRCLLRAGGLGAGRLGLGLARPCAARSACLPTDPCLGAGRGCLGRGIADRAATLPAVCGRPPDHTAPRCPALLPALSQGSGGGHVRCERTLADLPGFKQVGGRVADGCCECGRHAWATLELAVLRGLPWACRAPLLPPSVDPPPPPRAHHSAQVYFLCSTPSGALPRGRAPAC